MRESIYVGRKALQKRVCNDDREICPDAAFAGEAEVLNKFVNAAGSGLLDRQSNSTILSFRLACARCLGIRNLSENKEGSPTSEDDRLIYYVAKLLEHVHAYFRSRDFFVKRKDYHGMLAVPLPRTFFIPPVSPFILCYASGGVHKIQSGNRGSGHA